MTPEGKLVSSIKSFVAAQGGLVRKCSWEGRIGAPDLFILYAGRHCWVECKAPGEAPRVPQLREMHRMRSVGGCSVVWVDSMEAFLEFWRAWNSGNAEGVAHGI